MATWGAKGKRSVRGSTRRAFPFRGRKVVPWKRRSAMSGRYGRAAMRIKRTQSGMRDAVVNTGVYFLQSNPSANTYTNGQLIWQASDLPGISDFSNLFDEYCVNRLTVRLQPRYNGADAVIGQSASGMGYLPTVVTAIDTDGAMTNTTFDGILQYDNVKFHDVTKPIVLSYKPACFSSVQVNPIGGATSNNLRQTGKWISLDGLGTSVDFYGLCVGIKSPALLAGASPTYPWSWDIFCTADISFRKVS